MTTSVGREDLAEVLRPSAIAEIGGLMKCVAKSDLTTYELVGMVAILRAAKERVDAAAAPGATLTLLRPELAR